MNSQIYAEDYERPSTGGSRVWILFAIAALCLVLELINTFKGGPGFLTVLLVVIGVISAISGGLLANRIYGAGR